METSPSTIAPPPLLLRNLLISVFTYTHTSLLYFPQNSKLLQFIRRFLVTLLLFFFNLLPSFFSSLTLSQEPQTYAFKPIDHDYSSALLGGTSAICGEGSNGVSRALSQLLLLMTEIPVTSRKYQLVMSLIEKLLHENLEEGSRPLTEVNCAVLSAAFFRTLNQLEHAVIEQLASGSGDGGGVEVEVVPRPRESRASRLLKRVGCFGRSAWRYANSGSVMSRARNSAEKLAAELLWLAEKMAVSGCAEEAVCKWASASKLARLSFSAEPRLQGSLVKVSAFLIEQAKDIGKEQEEDGNRSAPSEQQFMRQTKVKMLVCWLPLLCRAHNGTDAPILSLAERAELEKTLEEIISTLEEDEQELVLSLWLHHFSYCQASDWPNMRNCYTQWYYASRTRLLAVAAASVN